MVKFSPEIVDLQGKFRGDIWRSDQCGPHVQAYPRIIKKRTYSQDEIRKGFADLHYIYYHMLDRRLRNLWTFYAQGKSYINKKGEHILMTGFTAFFKHNHPKWMAGIPPVWLPPGYKYPKPPPDYSEQHDAWELQWFYLWGG